MSCCFGTTQNVWSYRCDLSHVCLLLFVYFLIFEELTGWNQQYPLNVGDLNACSHIAKELVEENVRIPWPELRFMCGDVIYGGHMTDLIDRSLLNTYLESFVCDELMSGFEIVMGMNAPSNWDMPIEDLLGYVRAFDLASGV